jgi:hypothetical protein
MSSGRQLSFFLYNADEKTLESLIGTLTSASGVKASMVQVPMRSFSGDVVYKLAVTIGSGVTVKFLADLLFDWFKKTRHSKVIHEEEVLEIEQRQITKIVRRRIGSPK